MARLRQSIPALHGARADTPRNLIVIKSVIIRGDLCYTGEAWVREQQPESGDEVVVLLEYLQRQLEEPGPQVEAKGLVSESRALCLPAVSRSE